MKSIPTNNGACPACGKLLTGVSPLCYVTVEDYNADQAARFPSKMHINKDGKPIPCCPICGNPVQSTSRE